MKVNWNPLSADYDKTIHKLKKEKRRPRVVAAETRVVQEANPVVFAPPDRYLDTGAQTSASGKTKNRDPGGDPDPSDDDDSDESGRPTLASPSSSEPEASSSDESDESSSEDEQQITITALPKPKPLVPVPTPVIPATRSSAKTKTPKPELQDDIAKTPKPELVFGPVKSDHELQPIEDQKPARSKTKAKAVTVEDTAKVESAPKDGVRLPSPDPPEPPEPPKGDDGGGDRTKDRAPRNESRERSSNRKKDSFTLPALLQKGKLKPWLAKVRSILTGVGEVPSNVHDYLSLAENPERKVAEFQDPGCFAILDGKYAAAILKQCDPGETCVTQVRPGRRASSHDRRS